MLKLLLRRVLTSLIAFACLLLPLAMPELASAKSKKASAKTLTKEWEPYAEKLTMLNNKVIARRLFTPEDGDTLVMLIESSQMLQARYAKVPEFAPMLYQLAGLFKAREHWFEAFDAYQSIVLNYGESPYALKAKVQLGCLKQELGEAYAQFEAALPQETPHEHEADAKKRQVQEEENGQKIDLSRFAGYESNVACAPVALCDPGSVGPPAPKSAGCGSPR